MTTKPDILLVDQTATIRSPINDVYHYVCNHENYANWYPGVISVESVDEMPHGSVGKIYNETLRMPTGRNRLIEIEVKKADAPGLFITEGVFAPLSPRMEIRLSTNHKAETALNLKFFSRNQSSLGRFIVKCLFRSTLKKQSLAGLNQLKGIIESKP